MRQTGLDGKRSKENVIEGKSNRETPLISGEKENQREESSTKGGERKVDKTTASGAINSTGSDLGKHLVKRTFEDTGHIVATEKKRGDCRNRKRGVERSHRGGYQGKNPRRKRPRVICQARLKRVHLGILKKRRYRSAKRGKKRIRPGRRKCQMFRTWPEDVQRHIRRTSANRGKNNTN